MEKEKLKFKLDAVPVRFGGGYKAKMCARKRKWVSGPVRLSVQVSTSPQPTYLCNRQKNGEPPRNSKSHEHVSPMQKFLFSLHQPFGNSFQSRGIISKNIRFRTIEKPFS